MTDDPIEVFDLTTPPDTSLDGDGFLTVPQAAPHLGVKPATAWEWIRAGVFPVRIVRPTPRSPMRVTKAEMRTYLRGEVPPSPEPPQ